MALERDAMFGQYHWYCSVCVILHRFEAWWLPDRVREEPWAAHNALILESDKTARKNHRHWRLSMLHDDSGMEIWWHHVHLVMNKYFTGPECGLPLTILCQTAASCRIDTHLCVQHTTGAKIIDGELLLERSIILSPMQESTSWEDFWKSMDASDVRICHHRRTRSQSLIRDRWRRIPSLELLRHFNKARSTCTNGASGESFWISKQTVWSWPRCPTDYCVRYADCAENLDVPQLDSFELTDSNWYILLQSWHQVGACRDANDTNYLGLVNEKRDSSRNNDMHPPGSVRDKWFAIRPAQGTVGS